MLIGISLILLCQLIGEAVVRMTGIPVPGPVIGMALLIVFLWLKEMFGPVSATPGYYAVENTGRGLLANMSVLYVPASVGIIDKFDVISRYGWTMVIAIAGSTVLALAATALTFMAVAKLTGTHEATS